MELKQTQNPQTENQQPRPVKDHGNRKNRRRNQKKDAKRAEKVEKAEKVIKYHEPNFRFNEEVVERLMFKKVKVEFLEDLNTFLTVPRGRIINEVMKSFFSKVENLEDAARCCHSILEDLTINCPKPKVSRKIIFPFLKIMNLHKSKIGKLLDKKGGDKLLDLIPAEYIVDIIDLFDIKLSRKDASIFFNVLSGSDNFVSIPRFINLTGFDFENELVPIIQRLISEKEYKALRTIPNLKKLFNTNKVLIQEKAKMLKGTANYQFKSEGWQYLQEIFEFHPNIIANVINGNFGQRSSKFQKNQSYLEGIVSICERNPQVFERLKSDTKEVIKNKREEMIKDGKAFPVNCLRVQSFEPSSKDYFSFEEFELTENHIIWVDDKLDTQKIREIKEKLLKEERIAIDTESTLVRTPIDQDLDVLSLIQVSTDKEVYLFDPYNAKHPEIKALFKAYFGDKSKSVIGHTIQDDVEGVANFFGLGRPVCKVLDIKDEYAEFKDERKQFGLKVISKEILGKEICKKYTMTNWDRRPLNKCQIHYGAMDAFIIFKIWDKLSELIQDKVKNPEKYKKTKEEPKTQSHLKVTIKEQEVVQTQESK